LRQTASLFHSYLVRRLISRPLLAVLDLRAGFACDILEKRPPERDVQNLDAATDRENGKTSRQRHPDRPQLERIARRRHLVRGGRGSSTEHRRIDVASAGEQQAVESTRQPLRRGAG